MGKQDALKLVENRLSMYRQIKRAVAEYRADCNCNGKSGGDGIAYKADPTANKAIKNLTPISKLTITTEKGEVITVNRPDLWLNVAETTFEHFDDVIMRKVMIYKFIYHGGYTHTCKRLKINKSKYYSLLDKILWFAVSYACQLGLLKVK